MRNRGALPFVIAMIFALVAATPVAVQERAASGQQATPAPATSAQVALPEAIALRAQLHAMRVENAQLRAILADAQAKLAGAELTAERAAMEQEIRTALGCTADATIDWQVFAAGTMPDQARRACEPAKTPTEK